MIGSLAFFNIYKILNNVEPCAQQIVFTFWITPQLLFILRSVQMIRSFVSACCLDGTEVILEPDCMRLRAILNLT